MWIFHLLKQKEKELQLDLIRLKVMYIQIALLIALFKDYVNTPKSLIPIISYEVPTSLVNHF